MNDQETPSTWRRYALVETEIGEIGLAWSAVGLSVLQLPEADRRATERCLRSALGHAETADPPAPIRRAIRALQRYCRGLEVDFAPLTLDLAGIPVFRRKVYDAARAIGWGRTASYGELAQRIGQPGAARAVGRALGQNHLPIIIPCHRILAGGGRIGGFSAYGGETTKRRLLELEGIAPGDACKAPLSPGLSAGRR
jgi:methylated-DNA-[protein]-cysteine S-methyltransferase